MSGKSVLVVDDDETIRQYVEWALSDAGYEVRSVPDGAAALDVLRRERPDLILLDMRMPVMDGWQFASAYRAWPPPHVPIVVITADRADKNPATEIGAASLLAKPFDLEQLLSVAECYAASQPRS